MKWFYNMKISKKLILGFLVVAIITCTVGFVGIANIKTIDNNDTTLYENMTVPITYTTFLTEYFQKIRVNLREMILEEDTNAITERYNSIKELSTEMDTLSKQFEEKILSEDISTAFKEYTKAKDDFMSFMQNYNDVCMENRDDDAKALLVGDMKYPAEALQTSIDNLLDLKIEAAKVTSENNTNVGNKAIVLMIIFICSGFIISLLVGLFISSTISKPVNKIAKIAALIAKGDLNVDVDIHSKDEIGHLADSFRLMSDNLNEVMSNISFASEQVSVGSKQVSESSVMLAQGASEQASSIEELTASIEEISAQTTLNAENATQANKLSDNIKTTATEGTEQMHLMLNAMDEINSSSASISKIIKVIDEIAFQTNILALNAAVEAARAGQHGRGFAVVAQEVRNLAARSANAAKETTELIEGSVVKVQNGTKIAHDTANALKTIVDGIGSAADLVNQIATSSIEQSSALTQIKQSIVLVSEVVQNNSSTAEESSAASEELAGQSVLMNEQISRFKIKPMKKGSMVYNNISNQKAASSDTNLKATEPSKVKISLSSDEFGKY